MSRVRLVLLGLLVIVFAGCSKKETTEQQAPPAAQQPVVQPVPESTPQAVEAEPSGTVAAPNKPAPSPKAAATEKPAPVQTAPVAGTRPESAAPPAANTVAPARQPAEPPAPPKPQFVVIPSGTSVHVRLQDPLDSSVNHAEDTFRVILDRDIQVDGKVAAPRGSILQGKISSVARSGRVEGRAAMSLQLTSMQIADQTYPIQTGLLAFEAESTKKKDATKVGVGAGIGAVIGAIAGGGKGAAIGAAVGGGAGGATVLATRGKEVKLDVEHKLDFALARDVNVKLH
jgi:hypothetical protein